MQGMKRTYPNPVQQIYTVVYSFFHEHYMYIFKKKTTLHYR